MRRKKFNVVMFLLGAFSVLMAAVAILLLTFVTHCLLRDEIKVSEGVHWLLVSISFVLLCRFMFPFFIFKKDRRTPEERAKFYRIM